MPEEIPVTFQDVVATTERETRTRRSKGEYPSDLVRRLASPLDASPEQPPEALAFIPSARSLKARGALGPAIVLTKRITRRLLAWYVDPIADDQSRFNEATIQLLRRVERRVERLEAPWRALPFAVAGERELRSARAALLRRLATTGEGPVLLIGDVAGLGGEKQDAAFVTCSGDPIECLRRMEAASLSGIYLAAVLPRLTARDVLDIVPSAAEKLTPGGWIVADVPDPAHSGDDPRFQRRLTADTVTLLFEAAGLRPGDGDHDAWPGFAAGWHAVTGRRS